MYSAKIILDSISPRGNRLVTAELEFPRVVLAEVLTHRCSYDSWGYEEWGERTKTRDISKNSASSRTIPLHRMIKMVMDDPYIPEKFSKNGPGMQAAGWLDGISHDRARSRWLDARDNAIIQAIAMLNEVDRATCFAKVPDVARFYADVNAIVAPEFSVHKQDVNRLLEPWGWVKQIVTATEWPNFFALRCDRAAHPAFAKVARMLYLAYRKSTPTPVPEGEWHLPYVSAWEQQNLSLDQQKDISAARCAWVSYWPPDAVEGEATDYEKVKRTVNKLTTSRPGHFSPFEHQASPMSTYQEHYHPEWRSNLKGWLQLRKLMPEECATEYNPSEEEIASWGLGD